MIRMMTVAILCLALMPLASCATGEEVSRVKARTPIDLCTGAAVRRAIYAATIAGTDAYAASGRAVPTAVFLGREAAATALAVLNANCPAASADLSR